MRRANFPVLLLIICLTLLLVGCEMIHSDLPNGSSDTMGDTTTDTDVGDNENNHLYEATRVSATCETDGYTIFSCAHCGDSYIGAETPALGHAEKIIPGREATCVEYGLTDGAECYRCKKIIKEQVVIAAHGHDYESVTTSPTCDKWGYTTYTCSFCAESYVDDKIPARGHTREIVYGKAAGCTDEGLSDGEICAICGKTLREQKVIPALGHSYKADITLPKCEAEGYTTYSCALCSDTYVADILPANGHTESIIPGKAATATEDGLSDGLECSVCKKVLVEQTVISAYGHNYVATVSAPTCETVGYTTYTCTECGEKYTSEIVPALGHVEKTVPGKAASCDEEGLTDGISCEVCNKIIKTQAKIPKTEHSYVKKVVEPTCDKSGYVTLTCTVCNSYAVPTTTPALGHNEIVVEGYGASCTEDGLSDGIVCSRCNLIFKEQTVIPKKDHSYFENVIASTCEAEGYTENICSYCKKSYITNVKEPLGHNEGIIPGKAASCKEEGLTDGVKCTRCDIILVMQTVIQKTPHSYSKETINPTCETGGYTMYVCINCSYSYTSNNTSATGHSWQDATTNTPKTCRVCGKTEGDKLPSETPLTLSVTYIDVGQGDSIFLKIGDCDILIDAGTSNYGSTVSNYLRSQGVDDIELMINTHPDADHCGGLTTVLNNFVVEKVWGSHLTKTTASYKNFSSAVSRKGLSVVTPAVGEVYTYESFILTVIYNGVGTSDSNDSSIVVMVEYGEASFMFTGDISSNIERNLVSRYGSQLECDVLKVAHHGSRYSSCQEFLRACSATYGVICVGADNTYGHPTSQALSRLSSAGTIVYRTDLSGNIVFTTDGLDPVMENSNAIAYAYDIVGIASLYSFVKNVGIIPKRFLV